MQGWLPCSLLGSFRASRLPRLVSLLAIASQVLTEAVLWCLCSPFWRLAVWAQGLPRGVGGCAPAPVRRPHYVRERTSRAASCSQSHLSAAHSFHCLPSPSFWWRGGGVIRPPLVTSLSPSSPRQGGRAGGLGGPAAWSQDVPTTPAASRCLVAAPGRRPRVVRACVSLDSLATGVRPLRTEVQRRGQDCACVLPFLGGHGVSLSVHGALSGTSAPPV